MSILIINDKQQLERILRRDVFLHLYEIGDLDDFFWPCTTWYTLEGEPSQPLLLLYTGMPLPVLLALTNDEFDAMKKLIQSSLHLLPKRFYSHLSEGLKTTFEESYTVESHGIHCKMALMDDSQMKVVDTSGVDALTEGDLTELENLYCESYPEHWFDPRMLQTGCYFGIRRDSSLVSVAGIHVYSRVYKVATLGNVATHPDFRGQGLATKACAKLCQFLSERVTHIGLNVKTDNKSAITCYENLGFKRVALYEECMFDRLLSLSSE
ncbi:GNAT family N-acetyltransferase [bacterium]|nr:GNAT family N-acetyltransferase [bacterium]